VEYWQAGFYCQPRWRRTVDGWIRSVQAALWPSTCVLCRARGGTARDLCAACERDLLVNEYPCERCALPLSAPAPTGTVCGSCIRGKPLFDASFVPFRYAYPLDRLIQRFKYHRQTSIGRVLGELFVMRLQRAQRHSLPHAIVPVPLAPRRFRERGFNQAYELARSVARATELPLAGALIERVRETQEQAGLPRKRRRRNVRGAFKTCGSNLPGHVAIFDDVVTTGSTVNEVAKVLRRVGVQRIEVWAIARAARPGH
jgi:ComF family protein